MTVLVLLLALSVILVLLALGRRRPRGSRRRRKTPEPGPDPFTSVCPACGSSLRKGERVRSVAWPGLKERMVYIYGCPYCYGEQGAGRKLLKRTCPVCRRVLRPGDFLLGRMWQEARIRVHVIGCSRCRKV